MERRDFLKRMGIGTIAFGLGYSILNTGCRRLKNERPNILIIVTDDQGYADLSAFPHHAPDIQTPNMDRIAQDGTLCTQAYVSAPVCSPSRAGWNSGQYQ